MSLLSIERKTVFVALLIFVSIVVMATLQYRAISNYRSLGQIRVLVSDIQSNMLTLRRNEKDFVIRKDLQYRQKFVDNHNMIQANVQALRSGLQENAIEDTKTNQLAEILDTYKNRFLAMVELQKEIGFNHQDGLYGRLRDAIHQVEDILVAQRQGQLSKDMLMLRRREKDFMLRNDIEYIKKFDEDMAVMQSDLSRAYLNQRVKKEISTALAAYEKDFKALVSATQQMGFSSKEGLHGEIRKGIHQSEGILNELREDTFLLESRAGSYMINQIVAIAIALILFMSALSFIYWHINRKKKF